MEFRDAKYFRDLASSLLREYEQGELSEAPRTTEGIRTRGGNVGAFAGFLPHLAYLLGIAYYAIGLWREHKPQQSQIDRAVSAFATLLPEEPDRKQCEKELLDAVEALREKFPAGKGPTIAALVNALYPIWK